MFISPKALKKNTREVQVVLNDPFPNWSHDVYEFPQAIKTIWCVAWIFPDHMKTVAKTKLFA